MFLCVKVGSSMAADPTVPQLQDLTIIFTNVLQAAIPLIGVISFIMILVGGFNILTSAGNPENTKKGKAVITYAVAGIALAISSWLILLAVESFTGVGVTKFKLSF